MPSDPAGKVQSFDMQPPREIPMTAATSTVKPSELMRAREVRHALCVGAATLHKWRVTGVLCPIVLPGGSYRWRRSEVTAILEGARS
jgi:hypothetical protein